MARRTDAYLQDRFGSGLQSFAVPEAAFAGPVFQVEPCRI
jgi:formylmethanofuran dehydrogenase subunit A